MVEKPAPVLSRLSLDTGYTTPLKEATHLPSAENVAGGHPPKQGGRGKGRLVRETLFSKVGRYGSQPMWRL